MTDPKTPLLPCPFCGGEATLDGKSDYAVVRCLKCGAKAQSAELENAEEADDEQIDKCETSASSNWNRRTVAPAPDATLFRPSEDVEAIAAEILAHGEVMTQGGKLIPRHVWRADYVPPVAAAPAEPALVSYAPDLSTCTLSLDGRSYFYRMGAASAPAGQERAGYVLVPIQFLERVADELESYEIMAEGEWGVGRTLIELTKAGERNEVTLEVRAMLAARPAAPAHQTDNGNSGDSRKGWRCDFCGCDDEENQPLNRFCVKCRRSR